MEKQKDDTPGVIAPPPLIYLGFLVFGLALDHFWPVRFLPEPWRIPLAVLLIVAGVVLLALVQRIRNSHHIGATHGANFGFKAALASYCF